MGFRSETVTVDDTAYRLRELDGLAGEIAAGQPSELRKGFALIALSLCAPDGTPRYSAATIEDGVAAVGALPVRVSSALGAVVERLNGVDLDDARGN